MAMRILTVVIAILVTTIISTMLIQMGSEMTNEYGVTYDELTNDTEIKAVIGNLTVYNQVENETLAATSYIPGQPNSLVIDGTNPSASISQSSFTSVLKLVTLIITAPKILILTFGNFLGFNPIFLNMVATALNVAILLFLASIVFFRPW